MIFTSFEFLAFFGLVLIIRFFIRNFNTEKWFLLVASWLFYMSWNALCILILLGVTTWDYFIGKKLHAENRPVIRRYLLATSLVLDLGVLAFFKYANFLTDSWRQVLLLANIDADPVFWEIILPVGISFFIFQSLSYTFDIYRRRLKPTESWRDYSLFIAFFPQMVAGPILRASDFLPQITRRLRPSPFLFECGVASFLLGAVKKAVLSDQIAPQIDLVFSAPSQFDALTLTLALLGFAVQIFLDFSGYSDMAIGCACMMGFTFAENFRMPYSSVNITEFWRRWHITLSTWLRDYVYISFGGNRHGSFRTYVNLLATMLLGGLWHGASWNFVLWGGVHGLALCIHKVWKGDPTRQSAPRRPHLLFGWILTMLVVCIAWIPFRCATLSDSMTFFFRIASWTADGTRTVPFQLLLVLLITGISHVLWNKDRCWYREIPTMPFLYRVVAYSVLLSAIVIFGVSDAAPFIYFQF